MIEAKIRVIDRYGGGYIPQQNRRECIYVKYNGLSRTFYKGRCGGIDNHAVQVSCLITEAGSIEVWLGNKRTLQAFCVAVCDSEEQADEQYRRVVEAVYKGACGYYHISFEAVEESRLIPPTEEQKNFQK